MTKTLHSSHKWGQIFGQYFLFCSQTCPDQYFLDKLILSNIWGNSFTLAFKRESYHCFSSWSFTNPEQLTSQQSYLGPYFSLLIYPYHPREVFLGKNQSAAVMLWAIALEKIILWAVYLSSGSRSLQTSHWIKIYYITHWFMGKSYIRVKAFKTVFFEAKVF